MGQSIDVPPPENSSIMMFVVLALAAVAVAEPEADPALFYSGLTHPYTSLTHGIYNPLVYKTPVVHSAVSAPVVAKVAPVTTYAVPKVVDHKIVSTYAGVPVTAHGALPLTYNTQAVAPATQIVTNYKNPVHYTAEATPFGKALGLPKYVAKNGNLEHVVHKREADAEADPALVYTGVAGVHHGVVPTTYAHAINQVVPSTYTHAINPVVTYATKPVVKAVQTHVAPAVVTPAVTYNAHMPTYSNLVSPYYNTHVPYTAGVYKADHAVAATPFGLTHSSNVGLCFNNDGQQVSC